MQKEIPTGLTRSQFWGAAHDVLSSNAMILPSLTIVSVIAKGNV